MNKVIGLILVLLGAYLVYNGIEAISGSESSVEVVGVKLSATDEGVVSHFTYTCFYFKTFRIGSK